MSADLTVLIVDDDPDTREYLRRILDQHHPRVGSVMEAADGEVAWEILRTRAIHAVITNAYLPNRDGLSLSRDMLEAYPEIPVLTMSGDAGRLAQARSDAEGVARRLVLAKPFNARRMLDALNQLLAPRTA